MKSFRPGIAVLVMLSAWACAPATTPPVNGVLQRVSIAGQLLTPTGVMAAPSRLISDMGNSLVANGAMLNGALISQNAANMQDRASGVTRHLLGVTEAPLAEAEVFVADATGAPVEGIAAVKTDKDGHYTLPAVPKGFTFLVAARILTAAQKETLLSTLTATGDGPVSDAQIDATTTLTSAAIVEEGSTELGKIDPKDFKSAVASLRENLKDGDLPDLADKVALKNVATKWAEKGIPFGQYVKSLKQSIKEKRESLAELRKTLVTEAAKARGAEQSSGKVASEQEAKGTDGKEHGAQSNASNEAANKETEAKGTDSKAPAASGTESKPSATGSTASGGAAKSGASGGSSGGGKSSGGSKK